MKVSFFDNAFDNAPTLYEVEWSELITGFTEFSFDQPGTKAGKLQNAMFSPCQFAPGGKSKAHALGGLSLGVLDLDDIALDAFTAICAKVQTYDAAIYTTWQHPQAHARGLMRARLVVRLSRPCSVAEWPSVIRALYADLGVPGLDESCWDATRCYFLPALPQGCDAFAQHWLFHGDAWDVDSVPASVPQAAQTAPFVAEDPVPPELLKRFATRLSKRQDTRSVRMGQMLSNVLDGNAFAAQGGRDNALWDMAKLLAAEYPQGSAKALAAHFTRSLQLMAEMAPDCPTVEQLQSKIERAQRAAHDEQAAKVTEADKERGDRIELSFSKLGVKRRHPYTPDELAAFGDMRHRWIVQKGATFFVFFYGDYKGPFSQHEANNAAFQWLAASPLELVDDDGKPKTVYALVQSFGQVVGRLEADLTATRAYLKRDTFYESPCRLLDVEPTYSADVAAWLELLGGRKHAALLDWIAAVTRLDSPAPALYLKGAGGVGKSLLAKGLARLWGASETPLSSAMGSFNESILRCPLVLGDEKVPETFQGTPRTEELRELITRSEFELNRKYVAPTTVRGALRIMLCANNLKLISSKNELTPEDAQALADRFLFIQPNPLAKAWFLDHGGQSFTRGWLETDAIARHALWLRDTRPIAGTGRLIVPGDAEELLRAMQSGSGLRWAVLFWLHAFLSNQMKHARARGGKRLAARTKGGKLYVHAPSLIESWEHYLEGERVPTQQALRDALKGLVEDGRVQLGGTDYRALKADHLKSWCENNEEDWTPLEEQLRADTDAKLAN